MGFIYSIQMCENLSADIRAYPLEMSDMSDDFSWTLPKFQYLAGAPCRLVTA